MKNRSATTAGVFTIVLMASVALAGGPGEQGRILRDHAMSTLTGEVSRLSEHEGEVLVVNFWASWCAPCRRELPVLDAWDGRWNARGARVVAVSIDLDRDKAAAFVERERLSLPVYHDGPDGLARDLDLPAVPTTYVLDRDGRVVLTIHGGDAADLAEVERTVEKLLASSGGRRSS